MSDVHGRKQGNGVSGPVASHRDLLRCLASEVERKGGEVHFSFAPPIDSEVLQKGEARIGSALPAALRWFFRVFSGAAEFSWKVPGTFSLPGFPWPVQNPSGGFRIALQDTIEMTLQVRAGVENLSPEEKAFVGEEYAHVLDFHRRAVPFLAVGNGDMLVIDPQDGKVKYLSHDDPDESGTVLGKNFYDFMSRWFLLGCIRPDLLLLSPFLGENGINPNAPHGEALQEWLFGRNCGSALEDALWRVWP